MNNRGALKQIIGFTLITLFLVGCGGITVEPTAKPTIPPSPTPLSPKAILESAVTAMEELESYHFEMVIRMTIVIEGADVETPLTLTGDFKAPDRLQGELTMDLLGQTIEMEIITIGGISYLKEPTSDEWQTTTETASPFTPEDFVGLEPDDIANMQDLLLLEENVLDGEPVYHLEGKLSTEFMESVLGEAEGEIKVDYWIGVEDGWIRQANVEMELIEEGGDPGEINATIILMFSEFNKEIIIEAP